MARRRPSEPTANPARGAVLVAIAVVIGLFLLRNGLDTSEAVTSTGDGGSDASDTTDDGGSDEGTDGTTTTTEAPLSPAEVPTIVLNGTDVGGAAGKYSDVLASLGYQLTNPDGANSAPEAKTATTVIYFAPGFAEEAAEVGAAIGAPDVDPVEIPATPPGPIAGASVVVVIGTDLANLTPTTAATTTTAAAN
jgi:hypothetical protein